MTISLTEIAPLMRGYISGATLSAHPALSKTIVVSDGVATADDQSRVMILAPGEIDLSASGENGLDQGTLSAGTWYHCFAIGKADGTTARLASLSPTSPLLPPGYVCKRRIGAQKTNASGDVIKLHQVGSDFFWDVPVNDHLRNNPGTSPLLVYLSVPDGVVVKAEFTFYLQAADAARRSALITSPLQTDTPAMPGSMCSITSGYPAMSMATAAAFQRWTNSSGQIRYDLDTSGAYTGVYITTYGWHDPL